MNNCHQFEELISDYIEGMLDSDSRQQFDNHLKTCSSCTRKTNNVSVLHKNLSLLSVKQVSSDFDSMVRARIRIENKQERQKRESLLFSWKVKVPIYGMSVACVLFILITVFSQLSKKNTFSPIASMNPAWKNRADIHQNASSQTYTIYSLERKSAIDVFSKQLSRYLKESNHEVKTSSDSSTLTAYDKPKRNFRDNFYQTSF